MTNILDDEHHRGSHGDHDQPHEHDPHHWESADYLAEWAKGQDPKEANRAQAFHVLADTIPFEKTLAIRILDLGAGYGALTKFCSEDSLGFIVFVLALHLDIIRVSGGY